MNLGFWTCMVLVPCFWLLAVIFTIMKEKAAKLISGFNTLPKERQEQYDKKKLVKDNRNALFLWGGIMLVGAVLSQAVSQYAAIAAWIIWIVLFLKEVHLDADKAFAKYKKGL